uniref:Uncharacterized protein n=1 Tax=Oryza punctata TaxID=4537 RepID=A0A0E0M6Q7_ORYPU
MIYICFLADECRDISTKDLFCLKYLCKSFCLDEARNWAGTAGYVDKYWCKGQSVTSHHTIGSYQVQDTNPAAQDRIRLTRDL